jgi:hypothetical protein
MTLSQELTAPVNRLALYVSRFLVQKLVEAHPTKEAEKNGKYPKRFTHIQHHPKASASSFTPLPPRAP